MNDMLDKNELRKNLAANVRRLRLEKGISQTELAEQCGASYLAISRVENEKNTPSAELLYALADTLGVDTDTLRQLSLQTA